MPNCFKHPDGKQLLGPLYFHFFNIKRFKIRIKKFLGPQIKLKKSRNKILGEQEGCPTCPKGEDGMKPMSWSKGSRNWTRSGRGRPRTKVEYQGRGASWEVSTTATGATSAEVATAASTPEVAAVAAAAEAAAAEVAAATMTANEAVPKGAH